MQDTDVHRKIFGSKMLTQFEALSAVHLPEAPVRVPAHGIKTVDIESWI